MSSQFGRLRQAVEKAENRAMIQVFTEDLKVVLDHLWQQALIESVKSGEQFTRYHFANLVAAAEREACANVVEQAGIEGHGTIAAAAMIRARGRE